MTLILVHVAIIALITLICIKIKVWVPMLITLILSFTYVASITLAGSYCLIKK